MKLLLIGLGNMGRALAGGWQQAIPDCQIDAVDPAAQPMPGVNLHKTLPSFTPDAVLLAVKPQQMADALAALRALPGLEQSLVLSIAAGTSIGDIRAALGAHQPVIRAMPNTPALIGQGMTALTATADVATPHRQLAERLMQAVGEVAWLDDESAMDAFTAVAGSGPAYLFYLIESLRDAAIAEGLPPALAANAATRTILGAAMLASQSPESPETLRQRVTSPGGTTQAALDHLMQPETGLAPLMRRAIAAAAARSRDLSK